MDCDSAVSSRLSAFKYVFQLFFSCWSCVPHYTSSGWKSLPLWNSREENVPKASISIVVSSWWVKSQFQMNYHFKSIRSKFTVCDWRLALTSEKVINQFKWSAITHDTKSPVLVLEWFIIGRWKHGNVIQIWKPNPQKELNLVNEEPKQQFFRGKKE